jgi:tRNA(fMet)-specific endonuclease VapC
VSNLHVFDTDMLTLAERGHPEVTRRIQAADPLGLAITVISIEEQLTGWYTMLRKTRDPAKLARVYQRLAETAAYVGRWPILSYTEAAMVRCSQWRALKLNVGKLDLAIASIVLEHRGILVTRNTRDFRRVPGLSLEDWSSPPV